MLLVCDERSANRDIITQIKMSSNTSNDEVFVYRGNDQNVPMSVVSVVFHPSVVEVDNRAFIYHKIKKVVLNEGLKKIGKQAFYGCESLESITLPSSVTDIDKSALYHCRKLRELVLNEGLEKIGYNSFRRCGSLERISIPSSVNVIGYGAFQECDKLREIVFNHGLKRIGDSSFVNCHSLQSISLPSSVNEIGQQAFSSCKSLWHVTIPSSVVKIGNYAFRSCNSLREVVLNEGLAEIKQHAFDGCISLESITIPSSVNEIEGVAFKSCINLREVVVCSEEVLPTIGHMAFDKCSVLERITFPDISTRLEAIIQAGQVDIQNKVQEYVNRGDIDWRRGDTIYAPFEVTIIRNSWCLVKQRLDQIVNWIKHYEMKEATTLFELALWKAKIDQVGETTAFDDRDAYRVDVPGPVKDTILQYLQ